MPLRPTDPASRSAPRQGVVKRVTPDYPGRDDWEVIALKDGDQVVGAVELRDGDEDLVFVTSDAQLLRFPRVGGPAAGPRGRRHGRHPARRRAPRSPAFGAVDPAADAVVVTVGRLLDALPGTEPGSVKVTPLAEYPPKGRATGGVRCHRFLKGEDTLVLAWAGRAAGPRVAARTASRSTCPRPPASATAPGTAYPAVIAGVGAPVR